ncbi:short-chain collagen C4-like isoform X1 [Patiria miniata]|uniref:Short-chain collagen C4-like n=1 Tax=Patiria miniata TaxID=46514 RepID=A0A914BB73_PATMI|nr:short-chain collagen C4-like isoform X1 [Patiria miniata]
MAPNHKLSEASVDEEYLTGKNYPAKDGRFWLWFLVGTLLNVCIIAASVGLTVMYVHTELQSLKDQMQIHEERLAWLESDSSKQDAGGKDVPTWKYAQLRTRRDRQPQVSSGRSGQRNETHLPGYAGPRNAGAALCRDGRDGRDGKDGQDGAQGPAGPAGPTGIKGEKGDPGIDTDRGSSEMMLHRRAKRDLGDGNSSHTAENRESGAHDVYPTLRPSGGETYVRWGRTTCPSDINTELVYAGIAAGAHYSHKGGSVDFFCLPSEPEWSASHNDGLNSNSFLYGMEYEVSAFDPFSHENAEFLHNRDVPCAVCRLTDRGTQHLFPAKLGCPENWTEEYRGFLMSGHHGHEQRSKAMCVDEAPEAIPGSQTNQDGALLYIIEGRCGSLLCPPYVEGREITCTVCSI